MKLTWFGGTTLRVYLGGRIIVIDADQAPVGVDRGELLAGADHAVTMDSVLRIDPAAWRPKAPVRGIDEMPAPEIHAIGERALLLASPGESPLVILGGGEAPRFGRWAEGAVIVVTSGAESVVATMTAILDVARPRLIALAVDEQTLDTAVAELGEHLDGAGLVSLEPGLALEV